MSERTKTQLTQRWAAVDTRSDQALLPRSLGQISISYLAASPGCLLLHDSAVPPVRLSRQRLTAQRYVACR